LTANQFFIARRDISGSAGRLSGPEHHHLSRVARMHPGDEVRLFDESGFLYSARIEKIGPAATDLVILSSTAAESPRTPITLGQAVLKVGAMETVIQKATELGIFAIAPLLCRRSVVKVSGDGGKRTERWSRIALAAAKQSHSGHVPRILEPIGLSGFLSGERPGERLFLSESGGTPFREILTGFGPSRPAAAAILVGPEGGWDPAEEHEILASGYRPVSLGGTILRAETAAVAAAAMAMHFWNF
jgi:16S rRNA (uracil1498-N3)-methyltransferase